MGAASKLIGLVRFESMLALVLMGVPIALRLADDRTSISDYHDMADPRWFFVPLTAAAMMLITNGLVSHERHAHNAVLGVLVLGVVLFDHDGASSGPHFVSAVAFYVLGLSYAVLMVTHYVAVVRSSPPRWWVAVLAATVVAGTLGPPRCNSRTTSLLGRSRRTLDHRAALLRPLHVEGSSSCNRHRARRLRWRRPRRTRSRGTRGRRRCCDRYHQPSVAVRPAQRASLLPERQLEFPCPSYGPISGTCRVVRPTGKTGVPRSVPRQGHRERLSDTAAHRGRLGRWPDHPSSARVVAERERRQSMDPLGVLLLNDIRPGAAINGAEPTRQRHI